MAAADDAQRKCAHGRRDQLLCLRHRIRTQLPDAPAGCVRLLYVSLALRRSHGEYRQRLDLEDELRRQRDLFEQQSRRDGLTGLANRRRFSAALGDWCARARDDGNALILLLLDLDHFKAINDRHGHAPATPACAYSP